MNTNKLLFALLLPHEHEHDYFAIDPDGKPFTISILNPLLEEVPKAKPTGLTEIDDKNLKAYEQIKAGKETKFRDAINQAIIGKVIGKNKLERGEDIRQLFAAAYRISTPITQCESLCQYRVTPYIALERNKRALKVSCGNPSVAKRTYNPPSGKTQTRLY